MFEKIKTIFKGKEASKEKPQAQPASKAEAATPPKAGDKAKPGEKPQPVVSKPAPPKSAPKKQQTPEEMCGVTPKMNKDEVRERLAFLYQRYNRATSSLDAGLRAEAEDMLDAVVMVREKVFGPI